jgi:hypothetical protein
MTGGTKVTGQLWYANGASGGLAGQYGYAAPGDDTGYINSDGSSNTILIPPTGTNLAIDAWYTGIAVDTAAGYYWVLDGATDSGSLATADPTAQQLLEYRIGGATPIASITVGNAADVDYANALVVDATHHKLYASIWNASTTTSGIISYSYNPATGAMGPGAMVLTSANVGSSAATVSNVTSMALDVASQNLYFVADDVGYNIAPFAPSNAVYVENLNTGGVTQLTSSAQFPPGAQSGGSVAAADPNGLITGVAVDTADNKVFFLTGGINRSNNQVSPAPALWYVSANGGANQTATQISLPAGTLNSEWLTAGLSYDPVNRQLYIGTQNINSTTVGNGVVIAQLGAGGTSVTGVTTIGETTLEAGATTGDTPLGLDFVSLPVPDFAAAGTPAVQNGSAVNLLSSGSTSTDASNGFYVGATVQITGGTFTTSTSNENSASDDHLGVSTGGTSITASYNSATETLTLSGYDSIANYNAVLKSVQYSATGQNPTDFGRNGVRTITWTLNDGEQNIPAGSQNSTTTSVTVSSVDAAPVLAGGGNSIAYPAGGAGVAVDPALAVSDVDSLAMASATVAISAGFVTGDQLNFTDQNGIVGSYSSGVLTLSGTASIAQYQTALDSVTFSSTSSDPQAGATEPTRTISWTVNDGAVSAAAVTTTVNIGPAPATLSGAGNTVAYVAIGPAVAVDDALVVGDVDAVAITGATVTISAGLAGADQLNFSDQNGIAGSYSNGVLTLSGSASAAQYQAALRSVTYSSASPDPTAAGTDLTRTVAWVVSDAGGASNTANSTINVAPCYCEGTHILTARGEVAVEHLREGDMAVTAGGGLRPVVWIGWRRLDLSRHPRPRDVWPVRISAGAFGEHAPRRDLFVSPGHNIAVGGVLVPAILLTNGATIRQVERDAVVYYHVELDRHDLIHAEGLPAESYLDCGNRNAFANGGGFLELHPDFAPKRAAETCLPIRKDGAELEAAKAMLLARAMRLGFITTSQPSLRVIADGLTLSPTLITGSRHVFVVPAAARELRLASRVWTPGHMVPGSQDDRRLGVLVTRLECDGAPVDLLSLEQGWLDGDRDWRWTDGRAALPPGARHIAVDLGGEPLYWGEVSAAA